MKKKTKIKKIIAKAKKVNKVVKVTLKPKIALKGKKTIKKQLKSKIKPALPEKILKPVKKYKKNSKTRYTSKELMYFKNILINERNSILESAKANMRSLVDEESGDYVGDNLTYASHMAEQGTDEMEREKNYLFVQRDEKYLGYIQEALMRIDNGTYGVCTDCIDEPQNLCKTCPLIPKERLELVPITQHCIECKNIRG
jgi:RNA polymerase-binding transcription factor DksA